MPTKYLPTFNSVIIGVVRVWAKGGACWLVLNLKCDYNLSLEGGVRHHIKKWFNRWAK